MQIKFEWEELYSNCEISGTPTFQATFRAKVLGGWLIRHETACDYQYADSQYNENSMQKFVHDEGYQDTTNVIIFVADEKHAWEVEG